MEPAFYLLVFVVSTQLASAEYLDGPTLFLTNKMANFSTWISTNNLDPYPMQNKEWSFNTLHFAVDLSCTLKNYSVKGHSKEITVNYLTFRDSLQYYDFFVDFEMSGNITFYGEYTINGSLSVGGPPVQVSSSGIWNITVPSFNLCSFRTDLIPGDYVTIDFYSLAVINLDYASGFDMHFENLLEQEGAAEFEEYISSALFHAFAKDILLAREDPLRTMYMTYWDEIFQIVSREEFNGRHTTATSDGYTTTTQLTTATPSQNDCPPSGTDLVAHPTSCSLYFICVDGTAFEQECSEGLHFNPIVKECDFPENINCTKPLPECPAEGVSFHPYPGNCSLYVICAEGTPLVRHCVEGTCFNPKELKCRMNDTVAYDIPRQSLVCFESDLYKKAVLQCEQEISEGINLVRSRNTKQEFSICDMGKYKATFSCPSKYVFDFQAQDCVKEDV